MRNYDSVIYTVSDGVEIVAKTVSNYHTTVTAKIAGLKQSKELAKRLMLVGLCLGLIKNKCFRTEHPSTRDLIKKIKF